MDDGDQQWWEWTTARRWLAEVAAATAAVAAVAAAAAAVITLSRAVRIF